VCIRGEWGVGKTYIWKSGLEKAQRAKNVGLHRYSYVSLFGVNSLKGNRNFPSRKTRRRRRQYERSLAQRRGV